jgi:cytochrome c5
MRAPFFTGLMSQPSRLVLALLALAALAGCEPAEKVINRPEYVAERIQKVGSIQLAEVSREPKSGEEVYKAQCSACHAAGALGSPKFGDAGAWGGRVGKGYDALLTSALKGKGSMGPQGGGAFSDYEIGRAVVYMANAGGAKFAEPKKP